MSLSTPSTSLRQGTMLTKPDPRPQVRVPVQQLESSSSGLMPVSSATLPVEVSLHVLEPT